MPTNTANQFTEQFHQALALMKSAGRIAVLGHARPDEDAMASALALYEFLSVQLGKDVDVIFDPNRRDYAHFLPYFEKVQSKDSLSEYDLVVTCDVSTADFIYPSIQDYQGNIVAFDHHEEGAEFATLAIANKDIAATSQLMTYFFESIGAEITPTMAKNLLTGLAYDTGKFQHSNTTPEVLRIASVLTEKGAPIKKIMDRLYGTRSLGALKLWGIALSRVKINKKNGMAVSVITKEDLDKTGAGVEELSGLITLMNSVEGSRFSLLLTQEAQDKIKGSLRSEEYKGVDVQRIARMFGGGGHKLASGFTVSGKLTKEDENKWLVS